MSSQPLSAVEQRLIDTARRLAAAYAAGQASIEQVRADMRRAIATSHTAAMLIGTGANRSAEIDTALRAAIESAYAELDRALDAIEGADERETALRLEAFADRLETTQQEGERLTENPPSPLVPIAIGAGLSALLGLAARRRAGQPVPSPTPAQPGANIGRITLPRVNTGTAQSLYTRFIASVDELAGALARGDISLDAWRDGMRRQVLVSHGSMYRTGAGRALTPEDQARLNARIQRQLEYLDGFYDDLSGREELSEAYIRNRARMYMDATNASLQEGRLASIGLPALPAIPGDGTTVCRTKCKCNWRIVQIEGDGNYDAYWRLNPAEHCPTCLARAESWSPVRIRGGVLQAYERIFD